MQLIYKPAGLTINQFIMILKERYPYDKICYAGRLDPMARGLVPILFNEECLNMESFTMMKKIYQVMIMIGIQTDTDDGLGILTDAKNLQGLKADDGLGILTDAKNIITSREELESFINIYKLEFELKNIDLNQKFHYFSTKAINKRSNGDFSESYHNVRINSSSIIDSGIYPYTIFKENLIQSINKVDKLKDFRQKQIIEQWSTLNINSIPYIQLELNVSSGFFVRQFVRDLSDLIKIPLMAHDIHRIHID